MNQNLKRTRYKACALIALALLVSSSYASVVSINNEFGLGAGTIDHAQNLEFLDLNLSIDISYNNMIAEGFVEGGVFEGWRHATRLEILHLVSNYGIDTPSLGEDLDVPASPLDELIEILGATKQTPDGSLFTVTKVEGVTAEVANNLNRYGVRLLSFDVFVGEIRPNVLIGNSVNLDDIGHWLVRDVPSPSTIAPLSLSALLRGRRRRT